MTIPISQCILPTPTPHFPCWQPEVYFLHLWLYFCFVNKFMCAIILDSTYKWYPTIFVFLCLMSLNMTVSRLWTVVLEKTLESPLDFKEIKPANPKGNLSWIFIGRTDAEAEAPILWPPDAKNWLNGKDPDAGNDWRQEKVATEDEMVQWNHQLDGHEFEQAPGVGGRQGGLVCCSLWGHKEWDMTEWLNWGSSMSL